MFPEEEEEVTTEEEEEDTTGALAAGTLACGSGITFPPNENSDKEKALQ